MPLFDVRTVQITSGDTISQPFHFGGTGPLAVIVPTSLNTCSLFLQAGFSGNSGGTWSQVHNKGSDSIWGIAAGNGDFSKDLDEAGRGFAFVRFEVSAAPTVDQIFTIFSKV